MEQLAGFAVLAWPITLMVILLVVFVAVIAIVLRVTRNKKSGLKWALGAAVLMYLAVFWDHIPTVVVHKYYCEKEAGFWVYKTLNQWQAENPGVMETLHLIHQPIQKMSYGDLDILDERFSIVTIRRQPIPLLLTTISERRFVDRKTGEILVKSIDVGSSVGNMATGGGFKFWLNQEPCAASGFWEFTAQHEHMRGKK